MNILKVMAVVFLLPLFANAQKNEFSVLMANGILLNSIDLNVTSGGPQLTKVPNTLTQTLFGTYTRSTRSGFLYATSIGVGYETFKSKIEYPFLDYKFKAPVQVSDTYKFSATIAHVNVGIGAGYKFKGKWQPNIRINERAQFLLGRKELTRQASEIGFTGLYSETFRLYGAYGKLSPGPRLHLLTALSFGVTVPEKVGIIGGLDIGVQFQRSFFPKNEIDGYVVTYRDYAYNAKSREQFFSTHTSVSLLLGYTF